MPARCPWAKSDLDIQYHDKEWSKPVYEDTKLFEFIALEGTQAGLRWSTILKRREGYRAVFENFDAEKVSVFHETFHTATAMGEAALISLGFDAKMQK